MCCPAEGGGTVRQGLTMGLEMLLRVMRCEKDLSLSPAVNETSAGDALSLCGRRSNAAGAGTVGVLDLGAKSAPNSPVSGPWSWRQPGL